MAGAASCSACNALIGASPTGGTYSSVSPFNAATTCRYQAPAKTIAGCTTVTSNVMAYSGTSYPANTYSVTANAGYVIAGNGTASATCTACGAGTYRAGGSSTATTCTTCPAIPGDNYASYNQTPSSDAGSVAITNCFALNMARWATNGYWANGNTRCYHTGTDYTNCTKTYANCKTGYYLTTTNPPSGFTNSCQPCAAGNYSIYSGGTVLWNPIGGSGNASYNIPYGATTCTACPNNTYQDATGQASCKACTSGTYSPAGSDEAADCGKILHTGAYTIYLRSTKKTTPSLGVNVGGKTYYGNMTTGTKGNLRVNSAGTKYSVYDDSM